MHSTSSCFEFFSGIFVIFFSLLHNVLPTPQTILSSMNMVSLGVVFFMFHVLWVHGALKQQKVDNLLLKLKKKKKLILFLLFTKSIYLFPSPLYSFNSLTNPLFMVFFWFPGSLLFMLQRCSLVSPTSIHQPRKNRGINWDSAPRPPKEEVVWGNFNHHLAIKK